MGTLRSALGITSGAAVGDSASVEVPGIGTVDAIVDYINDWFIGLRTQDALLRFYGRNAFGGTVDAAHHLFAEGADGGSATAAWQGWLDGAFA